MAVSPADFELYSRATGAPIPRDPQERMRMAPEVYNFSRNFAREPSGFRKAANTAVKAAKLGSLLAGAYGVSQAFGPEVGAVASAVVDEVTKGNEKPVVEEKPRHQRTSTAVGGLGTKSMQIDRLKEGIKQEEEKLAALRGNETKNVRHSTPFREKMSDISNIGGIYDAVRTDSLRNELNDEFEEPYVRIPTRREEKPPTPIEKADNFLVKINGGGSDQNVGGNIDISADYKPVSGWGSRRDAVEKWADNVILEQKIADAAGPLAGAIGVKNIYDFANIATGGEAMGGPVQEAFTEGANRVGLALADKDPAFRAAHSAVDAVSGGAQSAMETISSWGFGKGHTMGDLVQYIAQHGQNLPGVENVENVLRGVGHIVHTAPIEMTIMGGTVAGAAALVGGARGAKKTKEVIDNVMSKGKEQLDRFKRVAEGKEITVKPVTEKNPPNKAIHTGGSIQGSEPGLGAQVDSGSPQTNRRREELRETFRKSLGTVPPEKREALIDQQLEKESNSKGLSQLKNFVSKVMSSEPKKEDGAVLISEPQEEDSGPAWDFVRPEQQGPATHLIRRTAAEEANPRNRYRGAVGVSTDPETDRTDIYFRASPQATGGSGVQMRSYYSDDPAVGRHLEHDALDTTQRLNENDPSSGYMMSDAQLKAKSFMKSFAKKQKAGDLRIAVDDEGNPMRSDDPWWGKEEQQQGSTEWVRSPDGKLRKKV